MVPARRRLLRALLARGVQPVFRARAAIVTGMANRLYERAHIVAAFLASTITIRRAIFPNGPARRGRD